MKTRDDLYGDPLVQAIAKTMTACDMMVPGDRILVGFSGGPDSTALLLCLSALAAKWRLSLGAAHLNHGLRGAHADREARHAADFAGGLAIPFITATQDVAAFRRGRRMSLEEAGREVRHRFLQRAAADGGYNRIALGHHRDDDAESLLMHFLRGSGPLGLAGIPPRGSSPGGEIPVIRPLIRTPRSAIQAFIDGNGIPVVHDESNADRRFLRNRVRHELLPLLKKGYNPALAKGLSRMATLMREEEAWLGEVTSAALANLITADHGTLLALDRAGLAACHPALQRRVLRAAVRRCKGDLRRVGFAALEGARRFAVQGPERGTCDLPDRMVIRARGARLEVQRLSGRRGRPVPFDAEPPGFEFRVPAPGRLLIREAEVELVFTLLEKTPPEGVYRTGQPTALFDMDHLRFPLTVRNSRPGDRMAPLGLKGSQKVKKIFSDRKIAREDRTRIPLVLSDGEIIWIAGLRQGQTGMLSQRTTRWLKVEAIGCLPARDDYYYAI